MNSLITLILFIPFVSLATPGFYGDDVKIKSKEGQFFHVEQAGYEMKIDSKKLPPDLRETWAKKVGQTFESPIPFAAIVGEKKVKNPQVDEIKGR